MNEPFVFRFDQELEPIIFGGELELTGWLVQREGQPIHGIRVVIKRGIFRARSKSARRKRRRPEVAAAFPDLPGAWSSGFLFELRFGLGRSHLNFQVLDHEQRWQTFHTASVVCYPLTFLSRLPQTKLLLAAGLQRRFLRRPSLLRKNASALSAKTRARSNAATRRVDLFATSKSNLFILEIGELVAAGFRELGCDARLYLDTLPSTSPPPDTLQIVVTPHEFYNLFLAENISPAETLKLTSHVHLLCTEQPETHWFETNLHWAHHSLGVADINPLGVAAYRARGLRALHLPLGYHAMLQSGDQRAHASRAHALTFLGSLTPRREEFVARHADFFAQHSCQLRFVPLGFAKTKETRSYLRAERRNDLLSDSRVLLNLHYSGQKYFEWHRMLLGLANGCCIISETSAGHGRLVPGCHFIMVEPEDLIDACKHYLAHPDQCEVIARAGQEFARTELRQAQTCARYLEQLGGGEQALHAFHLPPDHKTEPDEFSRTISRRRQRSFTAAVKNDLRNLFRAAPEAEPTKPAQLSPAVQDEKRRAVIAKREAYRARFQQQEEAPKPWEVFECEQGELAPQLTVLVTLYNYAHHIEECIASITAAAAQLAQPPEVVIVNDASSDASLEHALRLQAESKLPLRIVNKKFNTGLADARNVGTRIARAPYIFTMDADNLLFPAALERLLAAITAGNHAAAYSMLCRFRGAPANRVGLLSHFDFDPQILVQGPYIDAMAMFRRDVLIELGGYDNRLNQIGWFGWEDYELWLRIAQRGYDVAFVPNTLCLYRHHDTSMINTTNLFEHELAQCFLERYGDLLAQFEPRATVFGVPRENL